MKALSTWLIACLCCLSVIAQSDSSPIIFIYDASGSMWGQLNGKTKMEIAAEVLSDAVSGFDAQQQVGLVAYGHRKKGDCEDVEFMVDARNKDKKQIGKSLSGIKPLGRTPLAYSATLVINSLKESKESATVILITDGIESCGGNICDVVKSAKAEGIDFKLHIVGFGLKPGETEQLKCAASAGEGNYYDAADAGGLSEVLDDAVDQSVDKPAGNFGVYATKNGEPVDAYVIAYVPGTEDAVARLRTYKETRYMYLPSGTYDLKVTALATDIAPITVSGVSHNAEEPKVEEISFDGGIMEIMARNNGEGWDCVVKVRNKSGKVDAYQRTYGRSHQLELNPGTYDVEFQALVLEGISTNVIVEDQVVESGKTVAVTSDFESAKLKIIPVAGGEIIDAVVNLTEKSSGSRVANGRSYTRGCNFLLNPGTYSVKVTAIGPHKDKGVKTINVTLKKGADEEQTITF